MIEFVQTASEESLQREISMWVSIFSRRPWFSWFSVVFVALGVVMFFIRDTLLPGFVIIGSGLLFGFYSIYLRPKLNTQQLLTTLKAAPGFGKPEKVFINNAAVFITPENEKTREIQLNVFKRAIETEDMLMLFVRRSGWISFQRAAFKSTEDFDALLRILSYNDIPISTIVK